MKDVHQVLRQKESDIVCVRKEIEALRTVIPLLVDEGNSQANAVALPASDVRNRWPLELDNSPSDASAS